MAKEVHSKDLYAILGVPEDASDKQIVKGYRKRALKCHPDKNPDNSKATEKFLELSEALAILSDVAARAAYDLSRKAKKAAEERNKFLDAKRKKFKDDLEARERAAAEQAKQKTETAEKALQKEIERLRAEGSRLLEEEQELIRKNVKQATSNTSAEVPRFKLKWSARKSDLHNGGYSEEILRNILSNYGISTIIMSKRNGGALVELEKCCTTPSILDEKGLVSNPFSIIWLSGKPSKPAEDGCVQDRNYESIVLMRMRQAEERKRLIEQMKKDDDD